MFVFHYWRNTDDTPSFAQGDGSVFGFTCFLTFERGLAVQRTELVGVSEQMKIKT
jgi:hypothetical protein